MAGIDFSKQFIFHNPGKGLMETVTGKVAEIIHGQTMKFDVKATLVDVDSGNSLFPIYTFISKKEGSIEIDSATFTIGQTGIGQSVTYTNTGNLKNGRVLVTKSSTTLGTSLTGVTSVKCIKSDGSLLTVTQTGTADAAGVDVSATGTIAWGASVAEGEYVMWFKSTSDTATKVGMLKNDMPEVCSFTWLLPSEELDGSTYQVDIYAKRVRADGSFTIDAKNSTASVPKLTLKILDPGDGTDNFAEIVVSQIA